MKKLSKSDAIDKEQEARERELLTHPKLSMHFRVGTFVIYNRRRYEIMERQGPALVIKGEDGVAFVIYPIALSEGRHV